MDSGVFRENSRYIAFNIAAAVLFIVSVILSCTLLSGSSDSRLLCRVIARGILSLLILYNSLYLLFTRRWSFLCLQATPNRRLVNGIILGLAGLFGLVTAILGYGFTGDPVFVWWR